MVLHLGPVYVKKPLPDEFRNIIDGFQQRWDFPQCAGAIDGTHIPIIGPEDERNEYFNRKGWYSIIMQGVVDHRSVHTR